MSTPEEIEPRILERPEHPISRKNIAKNALKVLYRLDNKGYKAYLVGGSVRDLMLGRQPKDFDVSTDARPNEIRRVFRNSRIIGRRFRLAHIYFKEGIVEVATFRREPDPEEQDSRPEELLITSDNTYGTPRQDAFRRDFTVNALFYNIADFSVIDYVGGIEDMERKLIRAIGDPGVRFQEDPVRMLRACEFAGRLGFRIEARTQEGILEHRKELGKAAPARLTEEVVQLLRCGKAGAAMQWMMDLDLLEVLLPEAYAMLRATERGLGDFSRILPVIDAMVAEERELSDSGLIAALLLSQVMLQRYETEFVEKRPMTRSAMEEMVGEAVAPFFVRFAFSNSKAQAVRQALVGFHRLCEIDGGERERFKLAHKPYFDDALLLFEILARATGEGREVLEEWRGVARRRNERLRRQQREDEERRQARRSSSDGGHRRRRRRRRPRGRRDRG